MHLCLVMPCNIALEISVRGLCVIALALDPSLHSRMEGVGGLVGPPAVLTFSDYRLFATWPVVSHGGSSRLKASNVWSAKVFSLLLKKKALVQSELYASWKGELVGPPRQSCHRLIFSPKIPSLCLSSPLFTSEDQAPW